MPVTEQPDLRDWEDGLCDCTNDVKNCVLTAFCFPCMVCYEYKLQDECCGAPLCIPHPVLVLTAHHRGNQNIEGSLIKDCCVSTFCMPCKLCQIHRDYEAN
ncbi:hypothetical protein AAHC03_013961 [Spirometra sp. Aus1]|nr:unnamed protein product [Spirometra erinaceieuropaei]